jgi:hypothetical protein
LGGGLGEERDDQAVLFRGPAQGGADAAAHLGGGGGAVAPVDVEVEGAGRAGMGLNALDQGGNDLALLCAPQGWPVGDDLVAGETQVAGLLQVGELGLQSGQIVLQALGLGLGGGVALLGSLDQVGMAEEVEAGNQVGHDGLQLVELGALEGLLLCEVVERALGRVLPAIKIIGGGQRAQQFVTDNGVDKDGPAPSESHIVCHAREFVAVAVVGFVPACAHLEPMAVRILRKEQAGAKRIDVIALGCRHWRGPGVDWCVRRVGAAVDAYR